MPIDTRRTGMFESTAQSACPPSWNTTPTKSPAEIQTRGGGVGKCQVDTNAAKIPTEPRHSQKAAVVGVPGILRVSALLLARPAALTAQLRIAAPSAKSMAGKMIWTTSRASGRPALPIVNEPTAARTPKPAPQIAARHGFQRLRTRASPSDEMASISRPTRPSLRAVGRSVHPPFTPSNSAALPLMFEDFHPQEWQLDLLAGTILRLRAAAIRSAF